MQKTSVCFDRINFSDIFGSQMNKNNPADGINSEEKLLESTSAVNEKQLRFSEEPQDLIGSYDDMYPDWEADAEPDCELNIQLVMRRTLLANSKEQEDKLSSAEKAEWLTESMSHLRLDREKIRVIENLECFSAKLTHLYLQHNRIEHITGLLCLEKLKFLCLSHNKIKQIDMDELPKGIIAIYLDGNPCTQSSDYPLNLIASLPKLKSVDFESISESKRRKALKFVDPNLQLDTDVSSEGEDTSADEVSEEDPSSHLAQGLDPVKKKMLSDLDLKNGQIDNIEELLSPEQLQVWRTSYQQVQILSSSEEEGLSDRENIVGASAPEAEESNQEAVEVNKSSQKGAKKKKTRKNRDDVKLKTDKEKQNLKNLGINPAHFRDLTVKLLGRSRARQNEDTEKHNKKLTKLDSFREEESERFAQSSRIPVSERMVYDNLNQVTVQVLPERSTNARR